MEGEYMKNKYKIHGDTTVIFLCQKDGSILQTLIDTSDLPLMETFQGTWHAFNDRGSFYVAGNYKTITNRWAVIPLHRFLLNPDKNEVVDHINHDTLDNRRSNLRIATRSENATNRKGATQNSMSQIRGVNWHKRVRKWYARVRVKGQVLYAKYFDTLEEAEKAVKEARAKFMPYSIDALEMNFLRRW
jgi:hypothetical protein